MSKDVRPYGANVEVPAGVGGRAAADEISKVPSLTVAIDNQ